MDVCNVQKIHMPSPAYVNNANVQMFLTSVETRGPGGEEALQITSRKHYRDESPRWTPPKGTEWLESSDLDQYRRMIGNIRTGEAGVRRMVFEGRDAFWAFNPLGADGSALVVIVPHGDILAKAEELRGFISRHATLALGFAAAGMAVAVVLVVIISYLGSRSISHPLHALAGATGQIATGRLDAELPSTKSRDEIAELTESVASMREELKIYIDDLTEATSSRERLESELRIARGIQMSFLAKTFPPFPHKPEIDLYATLEPAREVGGDLYDFFLIDDTHLFFVIGDVSDKGVPAALLMAVTMSMMKGLAGRRMPPAETFTVMNRELFQGSSSFMFITLFSGVLDTRTGEVLFANAGHNPPIILPRAGEPSFLKVGKALVLAGSSRARYQTEELKLEPGDSLFLYTDGVTEAMNESGALFSSARLRKEMSALRGAPPRETIGVVMESVRSFRRSAPQSDDIAMMMIRYNGKKSG